MGGGLRDGGQLGSLVLLAVAGARPRTLADDPAQRPLRAAFSALGAARRQGRTRPLGRLSDLSCRDGSHSSFPCKPSCAFATVPRGPRALIYANASKHLPVRVSL